MTYHTRYFRGYEEVEYIFKRTLSPDQREMIQTYIAFGYRPNNGQCWTCDAGQMRILTGEIDQFENAVAAGEAEWPWPDHIKRAGETVWELSTPAS